MIPNFFSITRGRKPEIHIRVSTGERTVLCHAIDAHGRRRYAHRRAQRIRKPMIGDDGVPPRFHVRRFARTGHFIRRYFRAISQRMLRVERPHSRPAPLVRDENYSRRRRRNFRRSSRYLLARHVRTPENTTRNFAVLHERQSDGVLPTINESFRAVDWIENPKRPRRAAVRRPAIDRVHHLLLAQSALHHAFERIVHHRRHSRSQFRARWFPHTPRVFLRHQPDVRPRDAQDVRHHRLRREIRHRHRRVVRFRHFFVRSQLELHLPAQRAREPHRARGVRHD